MDSRNGHRELPQKNKPHVDDAEEKNQDGKCFTFREGAESRLDGTKDSCHSLREQSRKKKKPKPNKKRELDAIGKTCRQLVNEFLHLECEFCALNCGTCGAK